MNYQIPFIIFSLLVCSQCSLNETPDEKLISARIDNIITVKSGEVIYFQELDIKIEVREFSGYIYNSIMPPNSTMKANFTSDVDHFAFSLQHFQSVEDRGRQFYFDHNTDDKHYIEEACLTKDYKLEFKRLYWLDPYAKAGEISHADLVLTKR